MKADVWSLGIILFVMVHGKMPFNLGNQIHLLLDNKLSPKFNQKLSKNCKEILKALLEPKAEDRLGIEEICKFLFITQVRS